MKLTKQTPREEGLYWYTLVYRDATLRYCQVFRIAGQLCTVTDGVRPVRLLTHRWWAGPLRKPDA